MLKAFSNAMPILLGFSDHLSDLIGFAECSLGVPDGSMPPPYDKGQCRKGCKLGRLQ